MGVIQVRGVSDGTHRRLKQMAAERGLSLSEFLREELEELAAAMTWSEWMERVGSRPAVPGAPAAEAIREVREERDRHLEQVLRQRDAGR